MKTCTNNDASAGASGYGREQAWELLTEWTQSENLRKHALGVEACVRAMGDAEADRLGLCLLYTSTNSSGISTVSVFPTRTIWVVMGPTPMEIIARIRVDWGVSAQNHW